MIVNEKTLAEWMGESGHMPGYVFFIDNEPVVQIQIFRDGIGGRKDKSLASYSIFWRTKKATAKKMLHWAEETYAALVMPCCCNEKECAPQKPIQVFALYGQHNTNYWCHRNFIWYLFGNDANLDIYDKELQKIHLQFVEKEEANIGLAKYSVEENFISFIIESDLPSQDPENAEEDNTILFNFPITEYPEELLRKIFRETTIEIISDATSDKDYDTVFSLIKNRLEDYQKKS